MRNPLLIKQKKLNKLSDFAPSCQLLQYWSDFHGGWTSIREGRLMTNLI